ncbi:hypothetical protein VNO80_26603 [Phaseolus coccineus]|uniref:Uncharacterized protein n=1 Tax=Phaseolus coccineus TaxID=3886 RepID=A0AAN9LIA8_PHACN
MTSVDGGVEKCRCRAYEDEETSSSDGANSSDTAVTIGSFVPEISRVTSIDDLSQLMVWKSLSHGLDGSQDSLTLRKDLLELERPGCNYSKLLIFCFKALIDNEHFQPRKLNVAFKPHFVLNSSVSFIQSQLALLFQKFLEPLPKRCFNPALSNWKQGWGSRFQRTL